MFPHYNKQKRKNYEIPSLDQIKEREKKEPKKGKPDFFRNQMQEKSTKEGEQHEDERRRFASLKERTPFEDLTNNASSDTARKELDGQSRRNNVENISPDQTERKQEQQDHIRRQERERARALKNSAQNDINRNLQDDLKDISQSVRLRELNKFSMDDHDMKMRGVDPEKFRRVSQELSNALENSSPDQLRISTTREKFIEMAKKLGLIRPEV
jgi:hypothetical protein